MRFLVDECCGPLLAQWLNRNGHDAFSVFENMRGSDDETILRKAYLEQRILISNDKDFGERVHRLHQPHHGVILLRLEDESTDAAISVLQELLNHYADRLADSFIVVNEKTVRFARTTC